MFQTVSIENFRSIRHIESVPLSRINILTGMNSAGKTSFLEAIFLLGGANNAANVLKLSNFRGETRITPEIDRPFRSIFSEFKTTIKPAIRATERERGKAIRINRILRIEAISQSSGAAATTIRSERLVGLRFFSQYGGKSAEGTIEWRRAGERDARYRQTQIAILDGKKDVELVESGQQADWLVMGHFISPLQRGLAEDTNSQLSSLIRDKRIEEVLAPLRAIEPKIRDLRILDDQGLPVIYADIGLDSLMPISLIGSGFWNLLRILLIASTLKSGMLLIDEIENGVHHSVVRKILNSLIQLSKDNDLQVFITTHSGEILNAAIECTQQHEFDQINVIRFLRTDSGATARAFKHNELELAQEMNAELR